MQVVTAEVEETVFEPHRLRRLVVPGDLERNHVGFAENLHIGCPDLDFTGGQFRVDRLGRAGDDPAVETDDGFDPPAVQSLIERALRIDDDLRDAVVVAQVDENDAAVVADAVNPPRDPDLFADLGLAKLPAGVGAIDAHLFPVP